MEQEVSNKYTWYFKFHKGSHMNYLHTSLGQSLVPSLRSDLYVIIHMSVLNLHQFWHVQSDITVHAQQNSSGPQAASVKLSHCDWSKLRKFSQSRLPHVPFVQQFTINKEHTNHHSCSWRYLSCFPVLLFALLDDHIQLRCCIWFLQNTRQYLIKKQGKITCHFHQVANMLIWQLANL